VVSPYVLDTSAVVTFLTGRPAAAKVASILGAAAQRPVLMSVVNWGEVVSTMWRLHGESAGARLRSVPVGLPIQLMPAFSEDAFAAAALKARLKLPYADAWAAALAIRERATLVTSDPDFRKLGRLVPVLWLR
jgi:predicted nucleic acid-binding protein